MQQLFAARLQSLPQRQAKDFRLSSAAVQLCNIYLAFIDGRFVPTLREIGTKQRTKALFLLKNLLSAAVNSEDSGAKS